MTSPHPTHKAVELPVIQSVQDIAGLLAIDAKPFPDWMIAAGDFVWVANVDEGVAFYDRTTGVRAGTAPTGSIRSAMDHGFGSLWLGDHDDTTLRRLDLRSGLTTAVIALPFEALAVESSIAVGPTGVFALDAKGAVIAHVDAATNSVTASIEAPPAASALRSAGDDLWVTSAATNTLSRVDPSSGAVAATVTLGAEPRFLAIGGGAVWVMNNGDGTVSRVDREHGSVVATVAVSPAAVNGGDVAVGGGFVWARVSDALVAQIDPSTNRIVARYGQGAGSGSVAADDDGVWISAHDVATIWRLPIANLRHLYRTDEASATIT